MKLHELRVWQLIIIVSAVIGLSLGGVGLLKRGLDQFNSKPTQAPPLLQSHQQTPVGNSLQSSPTPAPTRTAIPSSTPTPTATTTPTATPTPIPTWTPSPTPIAVITGIHAFGRLETARYTLRDIVEMKDAPSNLIEQFSEDKLLLVAEGEVVAGFDLTKITESDIIANQDTVLLLLPEPEILYSGIDNEHTYVYERETGLFRRPDPDLETAARRLAEQQIHDWALERGILQDAEKFGFIFLENFLRSLGFEKIRVQIRR